MKTFYGLQALRYIAAILVVAMHVVEAINLRINGASQFGHGYANFGGVGVDIFFVISGFIMMLATEKGVATTSKLFLARVFLIKRLIRIVPLYWFYTALKIVSVLAFAGLTLRATIEPVHVACSIIFIPCVSPWGLIQPILPVGWTLSFEMFFYLIFAASIAIGCNKFIGCLATFVIVLVGAANFPDVTALQFYGRSIIFEFLFGMSAFYIYRGLKNRRCTIGAICLFGGVACYTVWYVFGLSWDRFFAAGISSFLVVLGTVLIEPLCGSSAFRRIFSPLGDSSYSLYLSHPFSAPLCIIVLGRIGVSDSIMIFGISIIFSTFIGLLSYRLIELPVQRRLSTTAAKSAAVARLA